MLSNAAIWLNLKDSRISQESKYALINDRIVTLYILYFLISTNLKFYRNYNFIIKNSRN